MGKLKGTKTLENLMKAFAGESQARNRYTFFASKAKKEGYIQIQNIFLETAANEKEHAEMFYKYIVENEGLDGEAMMVGFTAEYPVSLSDDTRTNLINAAAGEREEWSDLYNNFGKTAEEEGFKDIAATFKYIVEVEKAHEARYLKLAENIEKERVFKRSESVKWKCGNCGYISEGKEAPKICPACKHGREYFELFVEAY